jgi:hypothetical protein
MLGDVQPLLDPVAPRSSVGPGRRTFIVHLSRFRPRCFSPRSKGERRAAIFGHVDNALPPPRFYPQSRSTRPRRMLDAMPRTRTQNVSSAQWSPNGASLGQADLTQAGAYAYGANVFSTAVQRQRLPKSVFRSLQ